MAINYEIKKMGRFYWAYFIDDNGDLYNATMPYRFETIKEAKEFIEDTIETVRKHNEGQMHKLRGNNQ